MTRPARFSSADIKRALRVAQQVGLQVAGYEIAPNGTIRVLTPANDTAHEGVNPLEVHLRG